MDWYTSDAQTIICPICRKKLGPEEQICPACGIDPKELKDKGNVVDGWLEYLEKGAEDEAAEGEVSPDVGIMGSTEQAEEAEDGYATSGEGRNSTEAEEITGRDETDAEAEEEQKAPDGGVRGETYFECPMCSCEVSGRAESCPVCGASFVEDMDYSAMSDKDLRMEIAKTMIYANNQIQMGKEVGAFMKNAEDALTASKVALQNGNLHEALRLAVKSGEDANDINLQFEILVNTLRGTEKRIERAHEYGGDTADPQRLLELAKKAMEKAEYKKALQLAIRSGQAADRAKTKYDAWRVEVDRWL